MTPPNILVTGFGQLHPMGQKFPYLGLGQKSPRENLFQLYYMVTVHMGLLLIPVFRYQD